MDSRDVTPQNAIETCRIRYRHDFHVAVTVR
jgi:hypothetical protein